MSARFHLPVVISSALLVLCPGVASSRQSESPSTPLFAFREGFWINLHHFLYVLGRARNGAPDSTRAAVVRAPADVEGLAARSESDRTTWDDAVKFYARGPSTRDALFDDDVVKVTRVLAELRDGGEPATLAIDPALAATLNRAAPIY